MPRRANTRRHTRVRRYINAAFRKVPRDSCANIPVVNGISGFMLLPLRSFFRANFLLLSDCHRGSFSFSRFSAQIEREWSRECFFFFLEF